MPRTLEITFPSFSISNFSWGHAPGSPWGKGPYGPYTYGGHGRLLYLQRPLITNFIEAPGFKGHLKKKIKEKVYFAL